MNRALGTFLVALLAGWASGSAAIPASPEPPSAVTPPSTGAPAEAVPSLPRAPAVPRIRSEINHHLELHNFLQVKSQPRAEVPPEYLSDVNAYREARELAPTGIVWQQMSDACVQGADVAAIRSLMQRLPANTSPAEKEAASKLMAAFASAWQRYEANDLVVHNQSLQTILSRSLRRSFGQTIEPEIMPVLYQKMGLVPLDAPITVYPVVEAVEVGTWGRTDKGYYVVVPALRRTNLALIETLVHELTHVIESNQPPDQRTLQRRVRERAAGAGVETVDDFLHGLVAWTAGDLLRRQTKGVHKPLTDIALSLRSTVDAGRAAYEGAMPDWIDGRITMEEAVSRLAAALRPPATHTKT